jgi:protein involved in ribonucleotide reduction
LLPIDIVYFSHKSENTKRFVEKLDVNAYRIPLDWDDSNPYQHLRDYVLVVPTYGSGNDRHTIPKQVKKFLNIPENRNHLKGVIGTGNTNFGEHFCKAAAIMIAKKVGVPLIGKVEVFGTPEDITRIKEGLRLLYEYEL